MVETNTTSVKDVLNIDICSFKNKLKLTWRRQERILFSSKQMNMHVYFIYHPESGCHVTSLNQGFSRGRGKNLGTRL